MRFSFAAAVRVRRHDPGRTLSRRPDAELPFLGAAAIAGQGLLLDTCVYIDQMQARAPAVIADLLAVRAVHHSLIAVQEMLHLTGAPDPSDPKTPAIVAEIGRSVNAMLPHRLLTPEADVLAQAAVYAGILSRTQGYARDDRMKALHDCVLFLQAMKAGLCVLTRNVRDFDCLLQMRPEGRVLFYR